MSQNHFLWRRKIFLWQLKSFLGGRLKISEKEIIQKMQWQIEMKIKFFHNNVQCRRSFVGIFSMLQRRTLRKSWMFVEPITIFIADIELIFKFILESMVSKRYISYLFQWSRLKYAGGPKGRLPMLAFPKHPSLRACICSVQNTHHYAVFVFS